MRGDERGAGAAAAGAGDPGAALPDPQPDLAAVADRARRRYWRAPETAGHARGRARAPRDRPPRHRRRKRSRADCRYWCRPGSTAAPAPDRQASVSMARASGMSRQPVRAGPISTATCPSGMIRRRGARPRSRSAPARSPVSRRTSQATQRVALPQASASLPSGLRMRMKSCAAGLRGGSSTISWSQPMPVWRSAKARAAPIADRELAAAGVEHDKIVAEPVHLQKRHLAHGAAYMAAALPLSNAGRRAAAAGDGSAAPRSGSSPRRGGPLAWAALSRRFAAAPRRCCLDSGVPRAAAARRRAPFPYRPGSTGADAGDF